MKTILVLLLGGVVLIFMPAIFAADHHTPTQTQLSSQTERPGEETKIIFCRSNWDADEESGKLYVHRTSEFQD